MEAGKTFLSSSSTLGAALDLMERSVDEVVAGGLPPDPEELELMNQLKDWCLCFVDYANYLSILQR